MQTRAETTNHTITSATGPCSLPSPGTAEQSQHKEAKEMQKRPRAVPPHGCRGYCSFSESGVFLGREKAFLFILPVRPEEHIKKGSVRSSENWQNDRSSCNAGRDYLPNAAFWWLDKSPFPEELNGAERTAHQGKPFSKHHYLQGMSAVAGRKTLLEYGWRICLTQVRC